MKARLGEEAGDRTNWVQALRIKVPLPKASVIVAPADGDKTIGEPEPGALANIAMAIAFAA